MNAEAPPQDQRRPRVFISYSHDGREHYDRVLELAQQLRQDGIDAELDQFHEGGTGALAALVRGANAAGMF